MLDEEDGEGDGRRGGIGPCGAGLQAAKACPFVRAGRDEKRDKDGERRSRQEEQRGEKANQERRRRGDASSERAFQAAPAARLVAEAAATCSLVRPKRRSRPR